MTRVLVAASEAVVRAGLEAILSRDPGLVLVAGSGALRTLAEDVVEQEPEVVLLDVAATHGDELMAALSVLAIDADDRAGAGPGIVLLTEDRDVARAAGALHSGVRALLAREALPHEILASVHAAAAGLVVLAPEWLALLAPPPVAALRTTNGGAVRQAALSPRELEVLHLIADGLANKQIAARLAISEHTVKFHVASVFAKLHASTRAEAVLAGARQGMIVV